MPGTTAAIVPGLPQPAAVPVHGFAIPPRTLLLVEDSRVAAEAIRLICRRAGIRLRRADTLTSAALHLKVYRPDIVLVDLGLPDGSGLDLIAALHRHRNRPRRLVAVTGEATQEPAAIQAGADAFLLKPVNMARHLVALTGVSALPTTDLSSIDRQLGLDAAPCSDRSTPLRNAGADPLALRDDLRVAQTLLERSDRPEELQYAGQFVISIGYALHDRSLAERAEHATRAGDRTALLALIAARMAAALAL